MYVPTRYNNKDFDQSLELMRQYPFATVITVIGGMPFVSHLPLVVENEGEDLILTGHLARANPHAKMLHQAECYVIFHGPHAYITPVWYEQNNVPTWNYAVVHAKGTCELIEDQDGIIDSVKKLTDHMEYDRANRWDFWVPEDLQGDAIGKHIAGFKIRVSSIQSKFKIGQNRSPADREGAIQGLEQQGDDMSIAIAEMMKRLK